MKLRKGDEVQLLVGRDKGQKGKVAVVIPGKASVVVEGLNVMKRHTKPSQAQPKGGILEVVRPLPAAKVGLICPHCHLVTRVGYQIKGDHKERICRKCKKVIS